MSFPARVLILLTCLVSMMTFAEEESGEDVPSIDLLLFLGEWETDNGAWIDPNEFEDDSFEQLIETSGEAKNE